MGQKENQAPANEQSTVPKEPASVLKASKLSENNAQDVCTPPVLKPASTARSCETPVLFSGGRRESTHNTERRAGAPSGSTAGDSIKVVVRVRPPTDNTTGREKWKMEHSGQRQISAVSGGERNEYLFDHVVGPAESQEQMFKAVGRPIVENALQGYNSTVLAYGQTGSGKTHTMLGGAALGEGRLPEQAGLVVRIFDHLFQCISTRQRKAEGTSEEVKFSCRVSFAELYKEAVMDLLAPGTPACLRICEDAARGVFIEGLRDVEVDSVEQVVELLAKGMEARHVGDTKMNDASSRSHVIFACNVECTTVLNNVTSRQSSCLNLVDLAGSESQKATQAGGERLKEALSINKSLSTLGLVIHRLVQGDSHIPFRDSKLTYLLQDSLGGNARTVMICCVSPSETCARETLNTLNFARRAKNVRNKANRNVEVCRDMESLKLENSKLRAMLKESLFPSFPQQAQASQAVRRINYGATSPPSSLQRPHTASDSPGALRSYSDLVARLERELDAQTERVQQLERDALAQTSAAQTPADNTSAASPGESQESGSQSSVESEELKRARSTSDASEDGHYSCSNCRQLEGRLVDMQEDFEHAMAEIDTLQATTDAAAPQLAALTQERDELAARLAQVQAGLPAEGVAGEGSRQQDSPQTSANSPASASAREELKGLQEFVQQEQEAWAAEKEALGKVAEARATALMEQIRELEEDRDLAATDRDQQMLENDALEAELAKLKADIAQLRKQGARAEAAHAEALQEARKEVEGERLEKRAQEARVGVLESQVAVLKAGGRLGNAQGLAEKVRVLERELGQLRARDPETLEGLQAQVASLQAQVGELQASLAGKEGAELVLQQTVQGVIRARDLLKAEAEATQSSLRECLAGAERERAALRARVWTLQAEANRAGAEREEAVGALEREVALRGEVQADLEADLMEAEEEKAQLQARIDELERQAVQGEGSACGGDSHRSEAEERKGPELKWWQVSNEAGIGYLAEQSGKQGNPRSNSNKKGSVASQDTQLAGGQARPREADLDGEEAVSGADVKPDVAALLRTFTERFVDERFSSERMRQEQEGAAQKIEELAARLQEREKEIAALKSGMSTLPF